MGELRSQIWDYLYRTRSPQSVNSIADHMQRDADSIRSAVAHEWFEVTREVVAIAMCREGHSASVGLFRNHRNSLN